MNCPWLYKFYVMLQELILSVMGLHDIEVGAFCGIHEVSKLRLDYNDLTSSPQLCPLKCCLEDLQIAYNNISRLSENFLKGFKKLKRLNLSSNNLLALPDLHWLQHSLAHMSANKNKIQSLDPLQTPGIYFRLHHVAVYQNDIRHFNTSLLHHMPKLYYLNLCNNELNHIGDLRRRNVSVIILRGNPWHCGEELSWMGEEDMGFERGLTCVTPNCLQGMAIADMSNSTFFTHSLHSCVSCRLGCNWYQHIEAGRRIYASKNMTVYWLK